MLIWTQRKHELDGSYREPYSRDRARIIHSAFFRRLQGKTQVLGLGESDFYRTRLTHSLEVAQIGSGITEFLLDKYKDNKVVVDLIPCQNLIESMGLAHDIGHPPFGHGGEVALNYAMRKHGGFEGNAQTLRICTRLGESSDEDGLNLTRRTLLGLIKYPGYYSDVVNESIYSGSVNKLNIEKYKPPKCIFNCDKENIDWILEPLSKSDAEIFMQASDNGFDKHKKPINKSFDCSIMELADDIAYGVHDLEDAIALGLIKRDKWEDEVVAELKKLEGVFFKENIQSFTDKLFSMSNKIRKYPISKLVTYFTSQIKVNKAGVFDEPLLDYQAELSAGARKELNVLQSFVVKNVIKLPEVQALEYKGEQMIVRLFEVISSNPTRLLTEKYRRQYLEQDNKQRVICDYLAGTTDDYATRLYHKIFTPSSGSIFDKL